MCFAYFLIHSLLYNLSNRNQQPADYWDIYLYSNVRSSDKKQNYQPNAQLKHAPFAVDFYMHWQVVYQKLISYGFVDSKNTETTSSIQGKTWFLIIRGKHGNRYYYLYTDLLLKNNLCQIKNPPNIGGFFKFETIVLDILSTEPTPLTKSPPRCPDINRGRAYFPFNASFKALPVLNLATVTAGIWIFSVGFCGFTPGSGLYEHWIIFRIILSIRKTQITDFS